MQGGCVCGRSASHASGGIAHLPLEMFDRSDERLTAPLFQGQPESAPVDTRELPAPCPATENRGRFKGLRQCTEFIYWYLEELVFPAFMRFQLHKLTSSGQATNGRLSNHLAEQLNKRPTKQLTN